MLSFIECNNFLNNEQHGFRNKHSTTTALAHLLNHITSVLNTKKIILSLFLDLSKAFDSIIHSVLLKKLEFYVFGGVVNDWFKSYFRDRFQNTHLNGINSAMRLIRSGIPQGSILGPILFIIYVNDMPCIS